MSKKFDLTNEEWREYRIPVPDSEPTRLTIFNPVKLERSHGFSFIEDAEGLKYTVPNELVDGRPTGVLLRIKMK